LVRRHLEVATIGQHRSGDAGERAGAPASFGISIPAVSPQHTVIPLQRDVTLLDRLCAAMSDLLCGL
jgi:hypothetical protein